MCPENHSRRSYLSPLTVSRTSDGPHGVIQLYIDEIGRESTKSFCTCYDVVETRALCLNLLGFVNGNNFSNFGIILAKMCYYKYKGSCIFVNLHTFCTTICSFEK